uniref:Uncharacterized protein n=1 Tax=Candidatus Kentrum eta TaxID=2126337 RepID=A0A450UEU1_9GAMM|nr:MAG: hypothetical protein BECKH772A_GA0070896_1002524 [Candidatus Kentron sp. H]VFJ92140.1 MAG: hypothetical protein BECKH772B_GA0070898_1002523 [Candidatus Kentron sp. H]VFJ98736.1 MAG: hypothetical protein BECKH772C_GA0070978_1002424 [Candidatus Kentron sp. H]
MRKYHSAICLLLVLVPLAAVGSDEKTNAEEAGIRAITESITNICDKPGDAASYWEVRAKGSGPASVKLLNLADIGVTGEVNFSKGEWDGVRRTIEDAKDYRACARELAPLFIEKFQPIIEQPKKQDSPDRILGGIKYQQFGAGVVVTFESCEKKVGSVTCHFTAKAQNSDVGFDIWRERSNVTTDMSDQGGHRFYADYVKVANFEADVSSNRDYVNAALIKGVDTSISIRFDNVRPEAASISRVRIRTRVRDGSKEKMFSFYFRDIKMKIQESTGDE